MSDAKTQRSERAAQRIQSVRTQRQWTRARLAEECARLGASAITANVIVDIETGRLKGGQRRRAITIDELAYLAQALGVDEQALLTPPACERCNDVPPAGFTCNACGKEAS